MKAPRCPACRRRIVRRAPRSGCLERVLRHLGVEPFRCQLCRRRFRALRRRAHGAGDAADRREYDRAALTLPVSVTFHGERASGSITSLSLGGVEIATALIPPVGALVQIEIAAADGEPIAIDGALVRSVRRGRVGLQFIWARVEAKERLREIVLRALGHEDVDLAMVAARGPGLRSASRLADLWVALIVAAVGAGC